MKLAIGVPNTGIIKARTVSSLIAMSRALTCDYVFLFKEGSVIHWNREEIVKEAIKQNCTHLLFVDSDMYFEPQSANQLIARKKYIIGVHANRRSLPLTTTVIMSEEKKLRLKELAPDGLTTCDSVGTGFMLINLDVFKKIKKPWFFWENKEGELGMGEDFWFCERAKEAGYEIFVDLSVPMKHLGDYLY